jgi:hypothetical protein
MDAGLTPDSTLVVPPPCGPPRRLGKPSSQSTIQNPKFKIQNFSLASHPPQSPRFRRDLPSLERPAGAWLRDFNVAACKARLQLSRASGGTNGPGTARSLGRRVIPGQTHGVQPP